MRSLVSIRRITDIQPIPNKDRIVCAFVDGWTIVIQKDQFKIGDPCVYFEPDSFLPDGDPRWQMLVDKKAKTFNQQNGHVLKTIRMGGVYSNGFCVPFSACPELSQIDVSAEYLNIDVTEIMGISKYDPPEELSRGGATKGNFPQFIPKTDEERCQNLNRTIFDRSIHTAEYTNSAGEVIQVERHPENTDDTEYEATVKMDGSSMTVYHYDGAVGVCSRNLELKIEEAGSTFVDVFNKLRFSEVLPMLGNFAIQGELCGPGIQGNQEKFDSFQFFIFKIYDIDAKRYLQPNERREMFKTLYSMCEEVLIREGDPNAIKCLHHVTVLHERVKLKDLNLHTVADLLKFADGPSFNPSVKREGVVFKRYDPDPSKTFSFKAISEAWLANKG